jgi:hypothetical protein
MRTSEWKKEQHKILVRDTALSLSESYKETEKWFPVQKKQFFFVTQTQRGGRKRRIPYFVTAKRNVHVWMSGWETGIYTSEDYIREVGGECGTLNKIFVFSSSSSYATGVEINENFSKVIIGCTGSTSTKRNNVLPLLDVVKWKIHSTQSGKWLHYDF